MALSAADILVDREGTIAYKQLDKRPEDPTMVLVSGVMERLHREREPTVQAGAHRRQC
jgi:hypothetical protein